MPRGGGRQVPTPTARIEVDMSAASSSSSGLSMRAASMTLPTDIDFELDMSVIDQAHAEHTRRRRSSKKEGREEFNKPGYRSAQLDYIQYCALQGGSGCFFRGVQVPDEKKPWQYPYVTPERVACYAETVLKHGFQFKPGGNRRTKTVYEVTNNTWFEDHLIICPSIMDDRGKVYSKLLTWKGTVDGILKALAALKREQMATPRGKAIYGTSALQAPLRGPGAVDGRFQAIQDQMEERNSTERIKHNYDKFENNIVDGYGLDCHELIILHHLRRNDFTTVLFMP